MRDRLLCELPLDKAPKPDTLDRWELKESWLVVSADGMRAFERSNARAGEKPVGARVVFQAVDACEASPEERKQLQEARKALKIQAKQRRAQCQAEKQAAREAAAEATASELVRQGGAARCPPLSSREGEEKRWLDRSAMTHRTHKTRARAFPSLIGSNTSSICGRPNWWCSRWSPIRWWRSCSITRRGNSSWAIKCS
jgi:hypothetical protein